MKTIRALVALTMAACFLMMSMPALGYSIQIARQDTSENIGFRTYQLDLSGPVDSTLASNGPGVIVINKITGSFQDIPPEEKEELATFRINESVDTYPYYQQSIVFYNEKRTIAGAVDLMYFKGEVPPFETLNRLLVVAYGVNAAKINATADVSAALLNETFHGYPANINPVNNPLNNQEGYLVQIVADSHTIMNFLLDNSTYSQKFQFWGVNT